MERKKKKAGLIAIISLVGVLAIMGVVFATLSVDVLFRTSNAQLQPFNVVFYTSNATTSINPTSYGQTGTLTLSNNNQTLTISNMRFILPGATTTYNVLMKNDGTVSAKLTKINVTKPSVSNVSVYVSVKFGSAGTGTPGSGLTTYVNSCSGTNSTTTLSSPITLSAGQYIPFTVTIYETYTESSVTTSRSFGTISITPTWEAVT